jgi:hypothetical protein
MIDMDYGSEIVGATIKKLRIMTKMEMANENWDMDEDVIAIELSNGIVLYASMDEEGNGPGAIFGHDKKGTNFALY